MMQWLSLYTYDYLQMHLVLRIRNDFISKLCYYHSWHFMNYLKIGSLYGSKIRYLDIEQLTFS